MPNEGREGECVLQNKVMGIFLGAEKVARWRWEEMYEETYNIEIRMIANYWLDYITSKELSKTRAIGHVPNLN